MPTWIIGPALGEGPLIDRPADVLKVWPTREPIQRLPPAQFNPLFDQLVSCLLLQKRMRDSGVKDHVPTKIVTLKVRLGDGEHVNPGMHLFQEGEKSGQR